MIWRVLIHPLVLREDIPSLDPEARRLVLGAIRKKLTLAPEVYGEPLRKELFGYWKLRVGDFRVVYRIERKEVTVLIVKVGLRRDHQVYGGMLTRLKKLL